MKPRKIVAQATTCTQLNLDFIEHDGRFFLECEGRQVDGSNQGFATRKLIELMSRPFRPARQPRILFLGLGLGHAVAAARESLPQEKASFVVLPEAAELADLISANLAADPLDDERVHLDDLDPFAPLPSEYAASQGIFADLDQLEALSPKNWSITSPSVLGNFQERLKNGGLLGLIVNRPVTGLEKELRKSGFEVATDHAPFSEKSKKNRTLYLARKGQYQRTH
ncbi:hypothetical protein N9C66_06175 [Akkermansiaceae bacterium]|nr:hypothetical protein [Akkermansiaceae bacterium]MDA7887061.1 hypothetical protein [bacterium]MDA7930236.1 hypothetical protein [Akkermansiaceae bacterium]MDA7933684.1 hypothetical protein [Akkermansiaceae bacterium]MDA9830909.1 hypothetical protein [Akkermansiaceae bacterium]